MKASKKINHGLATKGMPVTYNVTTTLEKDPNPVLYQLNCIHHVWDCKGTK